VQSSDGGAGLPHFQLDCAAVQSAEDARANAGEGDPELLQMGVAVEGPGQHLQGPAAVNSYDFLKAPLRPTSTTGLLSALGIQAMVSFAGASTGAIGVASVAGASVFAGVASVAGGLSICKASFSNLIDSTSTRRS
jgi:hypothetical protein